MLWQILAQTPLWVFALFLALLYLGYVQSRPRRVTGRRLALLPAALGAFSLYGVYSAFGTHPAAIAGWAGGVVLAIALNGALRQPRGVAYDTAERLFIMPGSWIPLALMMTMFFTRYSVTVTLVQAAALADSAMFATAVSLFYGLVSGTFFARAMHTRSAARQARARIGATGLQGGRA